MCGLAEFGRACRDGLVLPGEARGAVRGLAELTGLVRRGDLLAFLSLTCPIGPLDPQAAAPADRIPLSQVRLLHSRARASWLSGDVLPGPP